MLRALLASAFVAALPAQAQQARFPGDEALALAGAQWDRVTQALAERRVKAVLDRFPAGAERMSRHQPSRSAKFVKTEDPLEIHELSDAVLVARRGAKITYGTNLRIIAEGDVTISFASAVVVIASGAIRVSHEMPTGQPSGGGYVTRSSLEIGHARDALVYAVGGANFGPGTGVRAFNTPFKDSHMELATPLPGRLFRAEPTDRRPLPTILALDGQSFRFSGSRCRAGMHLELLERDIAHALKEANCKEIESAEVRCEGDGGVTAAGISTERWSFQGCGRRIEVISRTNPVTRSVVLSRPGGYSAFAPQPPRFAPERLTPLTSVARTREQQQEISRLFQEGAAHILRRELIEARAKYAAVLLVAPDYRPALANVRSTDLSIARADEATAAYTARIDAGERDARVYADRGLAYVAAADLGRGFADIETAAAMAPVDSAILLERADAYLRTGRSADCVRAAGEALVQHPRMAKALELRAWCNLMENRGAAATGDARAGLALAPQKPGYLVIAGYFGLRQTAPDDQAKAWLREWRAQMTPGAWPDAFAFYMLREVDHDTMRQIAGARQKDDRGVALGEATVFLAHEIHFAEGSDPLSRQKATAFFTSGGYKAGYTMANALYLSHVTPGRMVKRREELK